MPKINLDDYNDEFSPVRGTQGKKKKDRKKKEIHWIVKPTHFMNLTNYYWITVNKTIPDFSFSYSTMTKEGIMRIINDYAEDHPESKEWPIKFNGCPPWEDCGRVTL